ncbi:LysR substrate-binding domain-containing protein [Herbaspirillum sp. WKF16]|jgi:DNA-binding transcriptional LysR family regulator|uniref:LysR substrate-binding domain-containing protein n=1 Tax=Herbaspirillum sp. WKF16 TaxID=3028312 RepID=UPI0023A9EE3B|nr:LysR substrate-binding domain-containing protein [Herbaspirillum sp. WKF16]WDZ94266.1 LysR substrate-binding domain-containing protein [Herbaspirillum sp. WKF16]
MELRHLRYFLVVAEEQHFTRAAERLGMQQPPLSQQIRLLEQELGFELFRRHPKGADLTAGGKVFLEEAKAILRSVELASQKAARAAQGFAGTISIGFTSSAAAHPLIPGIIRAYRQAYPGVHMALTEANAAELTEDVMHGKVDMGFLRQPVAQPQGIAFHALVEEEMLLILPAGHPLLADARKRGRRAGDDAMPEVSLKALAGEEFILVRRHGAPGMYSNLIAACENAGFTPKIALEIDRMLTNISLVAAGVGISVVPASMKSFHRESVVYCRVKDARPALLAPINLVCRGEPAGPTQQNFLKLAREFPGRAGG